MPRESEQKRRQRFVFRFLPMLMAFCGIFSPFFANAQNVVFAEMGVHSLVCRGAFGVFSPRLFFYVQDPMSASPSGASLVIKEDLFLNRRHCRCYVQAWASIWEESDVFWLRSHLRYMSDRWQKVFSPILYQMPFVSFENGRDASLVAAGSSAYADVKEKVEKRGQYPKICLEDTSLYPVEHATAYYRQMCVRRRVFPMGYIPLSSIDKPDYMVFIRFRQVGVRLRSMFFFRIAPVFWGMPGMEF